MKILIAGDFCPLNRTSKQIEEKQYDEIFSNIMPILETVDYSIVNFECPIDEDEANAIEKCGPNLKCSSNSLEAIKYAGFDMVTLANNHFYDYGEHGVINTINYCKAHNIDYVGGGKNINEAGNILYKTIDSKTIAIINVCENEFSIASEFTAGSNPLNPINNFYQIKIAKDNSDFVIVIVHGGHEGYQLPSPRMQDTYRFFIDCGADVVVNHHQHCYSGFEKYNGKMIFYGLGNFCFDDVNLTNNKWNKGYLLILSFENDIRFNLLPYIQYSEIPNVQLLDNEDVRAFNDEIDKLNDIISNRNLLVDSFNKFTESRGSMLSVFEPYNGRYLQALYNRKLLPSFLGSKKKIRLLNLIRCESHRDILILLLSKKI